MKLIGWILGAVVALVLILFAISNRAPLTLALEPFPFALELPSYAALLAFLVVGFIAGGFVAWLSGHRWRRRARRAEGEAARLRQKLAEASLAAGETGKPPLPVVPGAD